MLKFRPLTAEDVECRVAQVYPHGFSVLLYKNARVDMNVLDETVGAENWANEFVDVGGRLVCRLGIKTESGEWVWKADTGSETGVGDEKGLASDARKRAGFAWGIGRELYNSPFIWLSEGYEITRGNDGRAKLAKTPRLEVTRFESDGKAVTALEITDTQKKAVVFRYGKTLTESRKTARPAGQAPAPKPADAKAPAEDVEAAIDKAQAAATPELGDMFAAERAAMDAGTPIPAARPIDDNLAIALDEVRRAANREQLAEIHNRYRPIYGKYGSQRSDAYIEAINQMSIKYPSSNRN